MWVYKESNSMSMMGEKGISYQVGYIEKVIHYNYVEDCFQVVEEYTTKDAARKAVNFLNGGSVVPEVGQAIDIGIMGL